MSSQTPSTHLAAAVASIGLLDWSKFSIHRLDRNLATGLHISTGNCLLQACHFAMAPQMRYVERRSVLYDSMMQIACSADPSIHSLGHRLHTNTACYSGPARNPTSKKYKQGVQARSISQSSVLGVFGPAGRYAGLFHSGVNQGRGRRATFPCVEILTWQWLQQYAFTCTDFHTQDSPRGE